MQKNNSKYYIFSNKILLGFLVFFFFLLSVTPALAHVGVPDKLVPCGFSGGSMCEVCHLYTLAHNIIDLLLWGIATPLLVVALLAAGFYWLTSGGSEDKVSKGKSILFSAVVGFVIAFGAWVIINTIMDTLVFKNPVYGTTWSNTDFCKDSPIKSGAVGVTPPTGPPPPAPPPGTLPPPPPPAVGTLSHTDAVAKLSAAGISVVSSSGKLGCSTAGCTSLEGIQAETVQDAINLKLACSCTVTVTGGTEGVHSTTGDCYSFGCGTCIHSAGCKIDVGTNPALDAYIKKFPIFGTRKDGAIVYKNPDGTLYAKESTHWDISAHF